MVGFLLQENYLGSLGSVDYTLHALVSLGGLVVQRLHALLCTDMDVILVLCITLI